MNDRWRKGIERSENHIWKRNMAGIGVVWLVNSDLSVFYLIEKLTRGTKEEWNRKIHRSVSILVSSDCLLEERSEGWQVTRLCGKNSADPRCIRGDPAPCMTGGGKKFVGKCCGYYWLCYACRLYRSLDTWCHPRVNDGNRPPFLFIKKPTSFILATPGIGEKNYD